VLLDACGVRKGSFCIIDNYNVDFLPAEKKYRTCVADLGLLYSRSEREDICSCRNVFQLKELSRGGV
jgi:hypothetical protein